MSTQLNSLPPEILFNVLAYCEPTLNLNLKSYPLCTLAATNKQLNATVEEYARSLLKQHDQLRKTKLSKNLTNRRKWLAEICQLCKKNSKRKAIIYPTVTCCSPCDRAHFPKMTMTEANRQHKLSKLDLFTPNVLHPNLPRLAVGSYAVHGSTCTMLSAPDVFARRDHIHELLGSKSTNTLYMIRRLSAHDRIITHSCLRLYTTSCSWYRVTPSTTSLTTTPKSMQTAESRKKYARKALKKEWASMGVNSEGTSSDTAIELD